MSQKPLNNLSFLHIESDLSTKLWGIIKDVVQVIEKEHSGSSVKEREHFFQIHHNNKTSRLFAIFKLSGLFNCDNKVLLWPQHFSCPNTLNV